MADMSAGRGREREKREGERERERGRQRWGVGGYHKCNLIPCPEFIAREFVWE